MIICSIQLEITYKFLSVTCKGIINATSFPGISLLLRNKTLVAAGYVAPKIWEQKKMQGEKE